ncbi:YeiH family protein [uncultured Pseudoflavonifractor sp.]|uniref:YeiH family protein n=1 Tax=uncultured Pseudoflavonifractor sp. TaxID=1221379 RepID=UPI0025CB991F|nr:YeiH family protein [uncultured Pseudoflavonifractor sp.]
MNFVKRIGPGLALCLLLSIPSWLLGRLFPVVGGPVFAILAGMLVSLVLKDRTRYQAGIAFTSKKVLQYAVILLGFGLNLSEIAKVGAKSLPIICTTVSMSLIIAFLIRKWLKMPNNISVLVGVGSSICGGSAIAATAPVIGADDEEIAQSISVIFLFNILAALLFPTLGGVMGMSNEGFGLFAGTAINDTSSVTAAASTWDTLHGTNGAVLEYATIVKLTRTLAIIPITLALAFWRTWQVKRGGAVSNGSFDLKKIFPFFILFFVLASIVTTVTTMAGADPALFQPFKALSKYFIILAMAAIGLNTDLVKLVRTGGKPIFMGVCCWAGITCASLVMQHLQGLL